MSKNSLRSRTIRLASANKDLRPQLLRALKAYEGDMEACGDEGDLMGSELEAGRTWGKGNHGKGNPGAQHDWDNPYHSHPDSPGPNSDRKPGDGGGKYKSWSKADFRAYNNWYRKNVCPDMHGTGCGM